MALFNVAAAGKVIRLGAEAVERNCSRRER